MWENLSNANCQRAIKSLLDSTAVRRLARSLPPGLRVGLAALLRRGGRDADSTVEPLRHQVELRLRDAAMTHERAWRQVRTLDDWERFRDARIAALRASLGAPVITQTPLDVATVRTHEADGVVVENLIFNSRPGFCVTANLYRPSSPQRAAPGILICHSHHCDKTQTELQDMGCNWALAGNTVLVIDLVGHGERCQHPFRSTRDYRLPFNANRQDYYFRYNLGMQLQLAGESLMGWMVRDLMRAVDVLLERPYVDRTKIVLIGSVAGGGDVAAVTAALDTRISGVVAFGMRGTDVPGDVGGERIPSANVGSWESTRNLRLCARDGFLPWVILAACAPRKVVYAHEFAWEAERDPVWARLRAVFGMYEALDHIAATRGSGSVTGPPPLNTHCNNVGPVHRRELDPILWRWFGIARPDGERRRPPDELACLTPEVIAVRWHRPLHSLVADLISTAPALARGSTDQLRSDIAAALGLVSSGEPKVLSRSPATGRRRGEVVCLETECGIAIRLLLLWPTGSSNGHPPIVIGVCQHGRQMLRQKRSSLIDALLAGGTAVCLTDLRGTGPLTDEERRGRNGLITSVAASELMLGRTLLGTRLADLRGVSRYLRGRSDLDGKRVALWGDSLAPVHSPAFDPCVPYNAGPFPALSEPLGSLMALLGGLFEENVRAVYASGGLVSVGSVLDSLFCYLPSDIIVPGY